MNIVVDGFGGDNSPQEIVKGVALALNKYEDLNITITGDKTRLEEEFKNYQYDTSRLTIVHTTEVVSNNESPTEAIRTKKDSSLVVALDILKKDDNVCGLVSAGSTGAVLTGAFLKIGRMKGVSRPALAPMLPTKKRGRVLLIDCGANMDSKPINLCHYAIMGSTYMRKMCGIENPRVALLNVGVEDKKGNELCHEVFPMLQKLPINFVGNMEARDFLSGEYDVVVADGFAGNVCLKASEGAIQVFMSILKSEIKARKCSMFGAMFMKKSFKAVKDLMDYERWGGSPFLGAKKILIKSHGSSFAPSILASIEQVIEIYKSGLYDEIEKTILETKDICDSMVEEKVEN